MKKVGILVGREQTFPESIIKSINEKGAGKVVAEMIIQLGEIEASRKKADIRMEKFDRRMDLKIRRLVKAESRLEKIDARFDAAEQRMAIFDQKLGLSVTSIKKLDDKLNLSSKKLTESLDTQRQFNKYFLDYIKKNPIK